MTLKNYFHLDYSSSLLRNSTLAYVHVKLTSELGNYPLDFGKVKKSGNFGYIHILNGLKHSLRGHFDSDLAL